MKNRSLKRSFTYAFRGIFKALQTESNMRRHIFAAVFASAVAIWLGFNAVEWAILTLTIVSVMVTELLNTAVEYTIDMTCGEKYSKIAEYAKDIAAGATLLAAIGAVIIGFILYLPKLLEFVRTLA
jgi:diacylglycerol kinase